MEYFIEKEIKGYKKDYPTKKGTKITNPSLSIYLGAKTEFNPKEIVVIANKDYFYSLLDSSKPAEELEIELDRIKEELTASNNKFLEQSRINNDINLELSRIKETLETKELELETTRKDLNHKIELLDKDNSNLKELKDNLDIANQELKEELKETKAKLDAKDSELTEKNNRVDSLLSAIIYYKDVIAKYRELNIFKRLFKYDVEKNLEKPNLIELELQDNK